MINFRFHLVSLIAVFLALAVGIVMGYGVLGQPTVDTLQGRIDTVEARADMIRGENDALRSQQNRIESAIRDIDDFAITNRLVDAEVFLIVVRGVDSDKVVETVRLARRAGATAPVIMWLERKWGVRQDGDATDLAEILDVGAQSRAGVRDVAARALAARLSDSPGSGRTDLLVALRDAEFVTFETVDDVEFDPSEFDGRTSRFLVVSGNTAQLSFDRAPLGLVEALANASRAVVVADDWRQVEDGPERGASLAPIRDDEALSAFVTTVDHLDTPDGPLATVLALAARGRGVVGQYGFGRGADRPLPLWWVE